MNKVFFEIIGLIGYALLLFSLAVVAFNMNFWLGLVVTAIEMMVTSAAMLKDEKQDIQH